jgi:hypothetical protein
MSNNIDTAIDPNNAMLLPIDRQSGLFQLVCDIELPVLRTADAAHWGGICRAEKTLQE